MYNRNLLIKMSAVQEFLSDYTNIAYLVVIITLLVAIYMLQSRKSGSDSDKAIEADADTEVVGEDNDECDDDDDNNEDCDEGDSNSNDSNEGEDSTSLRDRPENWKASLNMGDLKFKSKGLARKSETL